MKEGRQFILFTVFFLLFLNPPAFSQAYKGKGRVLGYVYDELGNPLEGVRVVLYLPKVEDGFSVTTDKKGKWVASWIRNGTWNVDFKKTGYEPKKISIQVSEITRNPEIEVNLKPVKGLVITEGLEKELEEGNEFYQQGKYEEAAAAYRKILEEFPDAYIIHLNIGNCYFQQEQYDLAEESYKKILDKDPENASAMLAIGNCHTNRGDDAAALEWYRKIPLEEIEDTNVLFNIGTSFYNGSKPEEALNYYKRAVEVQPGFFDGLYQLGLTHLALGQNPEAIAAFEKYLAGDPDSERAGQVRGFLDYLKKD